MRIYANGVIHTLRGRGAQAMLIEGGRVAGVGTLAQMRALAGRECEEIDLAGKCVVPGFNDSHCHLQHTGVTARRLNLRGARSVEQIVERGREYIARNRPAPGTWVVGDGFDHNRFDVPALPTRAVADAISREHPVLLERVCGHVGTLNTLALKMLGFDAATRVDGGALDVDEDGELTGVLRENALYRATFSVPKTGSREELAEVLAAAMREMNRFGVTSVQSDDLEATALEELDEAVALLRAQGRMTLRLFEEVQAPTMAALQAFLQRGRRSGAGDAWYKIGNVKLLLDGSLGAGTAWMREGYARGGRGICVYGDRELQALVRLANGAGMQIAFHAIGDAAASQAVAAVELAQRQGRRDLRHRLVHAQFLDDELIARLRFSGMGADIQPAFTATDWKVAREALLADSLRMAYRWRDLLRAGVPLGGGSDSPVESCSPLWGMYCAVTRRDAEGRPRGGWLPQQRLTAAQALRLYTTGGAYLSFEEGQKGVLAPGALADFVVLSGDPLAVGAEGLRAIRVLETVVGGRSVWREGAADTEPAAERLAPFSREGA